MDTVYFHTTSSKDCLQRQGTCTLPHENLLSIKEVLNNFLTVLSEYRYKINRVILSLGGVSWGVKILLVFKETLSFTNVSSRALPIVSVLIQDEQWLSSKHYMSNLSQSNSTGHALLSF